MEKYRDKALDEPTRENVAAYYALQRVMLDKASRFTDMASQVSVSEPMLDENLLRPTASFGALAMDDRAVRATDGAARKLAEMAGLWFVYESTCPFCEKQVGPLKGLVNAHGFKILPIALDGLPLPGNPFPDFVPDRGQARKLGADTTPALFLVRPGPGGGALPIGQGLLSGDEIVRRAIALAHQKGWLDEREYQDTRRARPLLVDGDLGQRLDPAALDDPEGLTRLVRDNLRDKLRHPAPTRDRHD
jgi:conjugal transfer pilus assembly protein TraF